MDEIDRRYSLQPLIQWRKIGSIKKKNMMSQPRYARYKHVWTVAQDAVYWVDIVRAQRMGLKFYQTRSNAITLYDTLLPACIERVVSRKNGEILYTRIF